MYTNPTKTPDLTHIFYKYFTNWFTPNYSLLDWYTSTKIGYNYCAPHRLPRTFFVANEYTDRMYSLRVAKVCLTNKSLLNGIYLLDRALSSI